MDDALTEERVKQIIKEYISKELEDNFEKLVIDREKRIEKFSIIERTMRIEEELIVLKKLMEKRFELVDKRFESMDRRFEDLRDFTDKRIKLLTQIVFLFNIPILIGIVGLLVKTFLS